MISLTISIVYSLLDIALIVRVNGLKLYFDIDAGGQIQFHQSIHRLLGRIQDIEEPFVGSNLKLLP